MGYTHYLERNRNFTPDEFEDIRADITRLLHVATGLGIALPGYPGGESVTVNPDVIAFNGVGDESCDTFVLTREIRTNEYNPTFTFCKTWRRNYSPVVAAAMMVVKQRVPQDVMVRSDGRWDQEWLHGPDCYQDKDRESACKITDTEHVKISGRSLYKMAFPDSPEPRYTFESPLISQGLEGQNFYVRPDMDCDRRGTCFVGLPFGFNLSEMLKQSRSVNSDVCMVCGEGTICKVKLIYSLGDEFLDGRPMCEFCYSERLLRGKLTGYGYVYNPYQLLNSTLGNMDTTNDPGMFVAVPDIPTASDLARMRARSLRGLNVCATGKFTTMTRTEVNAFIESLGGNAHPKVSYKTDILVTGKRVGAIKTNAARDLGVRVMAEQEFLALYS